MPRQLRIEYPGALYRVMSRGDRREDIFLDDVDRQDLLKTLAEACQKTNWHSGALRLESAEAKTERIISEELGRRGWKESDLLRHCKSDPAKLAIAARLRRGTTLSVKTIAARMHLGTSKSANARLHGWLRQSAPTASASAQTQLGI